MIDDVLTERSGGSCELCQSDSELAVFVVPPTDQGIAVCAVCRDQIEGTELEPRHWFCLQETAWSEVPAVQVVSYRLLKRLTGESWAAELVDQLYLDEATLAWALDEGVPAVRTVDSNGTELHDGDAVTLIQDLDVKGANFTAKRGTMVKGIRLTDDPALVEGRVKKTSIYLKTCFLKRA